MDISWIVSLIDRMDQSRLDVLELEADGVRLRLGKGTLSPVQPSPPLVQAQSAAPNVAAPSHKETPAEPAAAENAPQSAAPHTDVREVKSPMVGVFHMLENASCQVGQQLKKGQPFCVLETMKLMNEIKMPEDGQIAFVAVSEGDMVEFDQLLIQYL